MHAIIMSRDSFFRTFFPCVSPARDEPSIGQWPPIIINFLRNKDYMLVYISVIIFGRGVYTYFCISNCNSFSVEKLAEKCNLVGALCANCNILSAEKLAEKCSLIGATCAIKCAILDRTFAHLICTANCTIPDCLTCAFNCALLYAKCVNDRCVNCSKCVMRAKCAARVKLGYATVELCNLICLLNVKLFRESNPGPLAPQADALTTRPRKTFVSNSSEIWTAFGSDRHSHDGRVTTMFRLGLASKSKKVPNKKLQVATHPMRRLIHIRGVYRFLIASLTPLRQKLNNTNV